MTKLLRKLIASIRMTFVADCPRCHCHFYGFHAYKTTVKIERHYRIICHRCHGDYNAKIVG